MNVCFFARVKDKRLLDLIQFYKNDIKILNELGHNVIIATKFKEIPWNSSLYCSWWCTTSIFPLIKAKLKHKPLVVLGCGSEVINSKEDIPGFHSKSFPIRLLIHLCLKMADYTLAISNHQLYEIKRLGVKKCRTVYVGIDSEQYVPGIASDFKEDTILTISHLNKENVDRKNIWTVLKAIPHVIPKFPDVRFVLIGRHMDAYEELVQYVNSAGIERNVEFPGLVSNEEKLAYLRKSKMYVQPTKHEAFGVAIAEAMCCELPVISSNVGSVPEVLGDCGLYVDPDDHIALAQNIILLLKDEKLRREMGKKGRERILQIFPVEKRKYEIQEVLKELMI